MGYDSYRREADRSPKPTQTEILRYVYSDWPAYKMWLRTMREVRNLLGNTRSINLLIQRSCQLYGAQYPAPYTLYTVAEMEDFVEKIRKTFAKDESFIRYLPAIIKLNGGIGYNYDTIAVILIHLLYVENLLAPNTYFLKRVGYLK